MENFSLRGYIFISLIYCTFKCMGVDSNKEFSLKKSELCGSLSWTWNEDDSKCLKYLKMDTSTKDYTEAEALCTQEQASVLPSIESTTEEEFLVNFVQNSTQTSSLTEIFLAIQKTFINSTMGQSESPQNNLQQCLHMNGHRVTNGSLIISDWNYINNCQNVNWIVCQKPTSWAPSKIQKELLDHKKWSRELAEELKSARMIMTEMSRQMTEMKREIVQIQNKITTTTTSTSSIPIGFIYIQYGSQLSPSSLWPTFSWSDITGQYAGQFFRAQGGNSGGFGVLQSDNSPRITSVEYEDHENHPTSTGLPVGGRSASVRSGNWNGNGDKVGLVFTTSPGEVRPINSAIKIWKRTA